MCFEADSNCCSIIEQSLVISKYDLLTLVIVLDYDYESTMKAVR